MNIGKGRLKKFVLLGVLVSTSFVHGMNLNDTLHDVLATHPDILEKQKSYNTAIFNTKAAGAGNFPIVVFEGEVGYQTKKDSSTSYKNKESRYWDARITARQNIYDGGKVSLDEDVRNAYAWSALYGYLRVANTKIYETIRAYINVLKLYKLKNLSMENVQIHQNILESAKLRLKNGGQGRSELERVLGRLSIARTKMLLRKSEYEKSLYVLHKLLGRFVAYEDMVKPAFDDSLLPISLKEALLTQITYHPAYKEGDYAVSHKEFEHKRQKSERMGRLYLEASAGASDESRKEDENDAYVALKYEHTLYAGGKRGEKIQGAISAMHQEQQKQYSVRRSLMHDLELTWSSYRLLYSQIGELKKSLYFTKKALKTYQEEFRIGRRMLITILDAQNEYQNAQDQLISMQYDLLIEKFRVLQAQGTLLASLGLLTDEVETLLKQNAKDKKPMSKDTLPLSEDFDGDGVKDPQDLSVNNIPNELVNSLGVNKKMMVESKLDNTIVKTETTKVRIIKSKQDMIDNPIKPGVLARFDFVSFAPESIELSSASQNTMRYLVNQLKNYASEGMLYVTVGTNEFDNEALNYKLAMNRVYNFKRILQEHNIYPSSIAVFPDTKTKKPPSYLAVKIVNDGKDYGKQYSTKSIPKSIFKRGAHKLHKEGEKFLDNLAQEITLNDAKHVDIVVYSNDYKNPIENRNISIQRADEIYKELVKRGVKSSKLFSFGWGEYKDTSLLMYDNKEGVSRVEYVLRDE